MEASECRPIHMFLWKIASRCNIDCSYCYIYQSPDTLWKRQPRFMSEEVARQTAVRIREHCQGHNKQEVSIVFHGGEPMMGGVEHLKILTTVIDEELRAHGIVVKQGMQSNGLLFTKEIGDFLLKKGISLGISLDGPPEVNDIHRVDHRGHPTTKALEEKLQLITTDRYLKLLSGVLCVINAESDPVAVIDYLISWKTPNIDFLLPLNNHQRLPKGKEIDRHAAPYGEWLVQGFDHWISLTNPPGIRIYDSIVSLLLGAYSSVESLGLGPVDLIVVETNGEIEGLDCLKTTFEGATQLGLNVSDNTFDDAVNHERVLRRQLGLDALCLTCQECPIVSVCGGGYLPHRFSPENGFMNPSVYCADLYMLIEHINGKVREQFESLKGGTSLMANLAEPPF